MGYYLNIVSVENDGVEVMVECYGLLFELITEDIQAYRAESAMSFVQYIRAFGFDDTIIHIGINEVSDKRITHEWSGTDTVLSRLYSLATVFDAEIEFVTELNDDYNLKRLTMNIYRAHDDKYQGLGTDRSAEVLRFGDELTLIRSKEDISELYTVIRPKGSDELTLTSLPERKIYDDDGELLYWHPAGSNVIFAPQAKERYPATALSTADGWIAHNWDYQTDNVEVLYGQALAQLKKNSVPQVSYTVEGFIDAEIGDTFTLADERRKPALYVEARIVEQVICFTDPSRNKTTFDNFTTLQSQVSDSVMERMAQMIEASRMYTGLIISSNGTAFKNNTGSTVLTARVMDGITDVTDSMAIQWLKNGVNLSTGKSITVTASQVTDKAVYRFDAYKNDVLKATAEVTVTDVSDGINGDDGITPVITVDKTNKVTTVMVTTGEDVQSAQILDGDKGDKGDTGEQGPQGAKGDNGADGRGVSSITRQYYLSTSNTSQTGGSWSANIPAYVNGRYYWVREMITYTNPTGTTYTTAKLDNGLNNANSVAATAKSTADTAKTTADTAKSTADTAKATAEEALADVDTLRTDVESDIEYSKTQIYERISADMHVLNESVQSIVNANYYTVDEANLLIQQISSISSQLIQTASQITALFTSVQTAQSTTDGAAGTLATWFNFDSSGLGIGKSDSGVSLQLTNDRLGFYLNGAEVAYMSDSKLYITDGTFLGSLQLGNFAFVPNSAGNLSFKKVTQ